MIFDFKRELGKMTPLIGQGATVYIFGASGHWDYICGLFKRLLNVNLDDSVAGFIDNDPKKQGTVFHNKPVKAFSDIDISSSVIIIATYNSRSNLDIALQLDKAGMICPHSFFMSNCFVNILMRYEYERFLQFKDKHKGQRCFIIGNGPSLLVEDLDRIKNEMSFATNKIYTLFDKTLWRPSYYAIHDDNLLRNLHNEIKARVQCPIFYAYNTVMDIDDFSLNNEYFYFVDGCVDWKPDPFSIPAFSVEPFVVQWGATILYDCIQFAVYMGFDEIYMLGVDNSFPLSIKYNGELILKNVKSHFSSAYGVNVHKARSDICNRAYKVAEETSRKFGVKIYNATRGGELEIFERVNFDSLF